MKLLFVKITAFLFLFAGSSFAQNYITFMNGRVINNIQNVEFKDKKIRYLLNEKKKAADPEKVFSLHVNGKETVIYKQDSVIEYFMTIAQMREFIKGEQDAESPPLKGTLAEGIATGAVSGLLIPVQPALVFIPIGAIDFLITSKATSTAVNGKGEEYTSGYYSKLRARKIKKAVIGNGVGLFATLTVFLIMGALNR